MKIIPCKQYSPTWWRARRGLPTASNGKRVVTAVKGDMSDTAVLYACELIAELLTPGDYWLDQVDPKSQSMAHGSRTEEEARKSVSIILDEDIPEVGFVTNDAGTAGCSPDGLREDRSRGYEIKCPELKTHVKYLIDDVLPKEYKAQVHWAMAITGASEWMFISYHKLVDPFMFMVERDSYTDAVAKAIDNFVAMQAGMWQRINDKLKRPDTENFDVGF